MENKKVTLEGRVLEEMGNGRFSEKFLDYEISAEYKHFRDLIGNISQGFSNFIIQEVGKDGLSHCYQFSESEKLNSFDLVEKTASNGFAVMAVDPSLKKKSGFIKSSGMTRKIEEANLNDLIKAESIAHEELPKYKDYILIVIAPCKEKQDYLDEHLPDPRKKINEKTRIKVYAKFSGHCAYCGKSITFKEMQIDHMQSHVNNKGKDEIENYYPSCSVCNREKSSRTLEDFRNFIENDAPRIHYARRKPLMADADKICEAYNLKPKGNKIVFLFERENKKNG